MEIPSDTSKSQWKLIKKAARYQWQTNLDDAEKLVETQHSDNIWLYAAYTEVSLWRWNYTQQVQYESELVRRMQLFEQHSQSIYNKNNPNNAWFGKSLRTDITGEEQYRRFLIGIVALAYSELCYTLYHFRKRNLVKGAYHARRSWIYFREARDFMEKQEQLGHPPNDAKVVGLVNFGVGLFHFGLSLVPPSYVWLTKALGFEADRDNAIVSLRKSLDSRGPKSVESAVLLVVMYQFFLDEEEEALKLVNKLDASYPKSPVLAYMGAFIKRINGNVDDAISDFQVAIKGIEIEQLRITMHYHLAVTYFMKAEYEQAIPLIELFLEKSTIDQFRPYASYLLGVCYWITEIKKDNIKPLFEAIKGAVKPDQAYDIHAERKAKEFFANGNAFTAFDIAWIEASMMHESRKYKACLAKLKDLKRTAAADGQIPAERLCRILWIKGSCLRGLNKFDKAKRYLERCLELDGDVKAEKFAMAYSHLDLAEICLAEHTFDLALSHLKKAKSYKDYDWANVISMRITSAEQRTQTRRRLASSGTVRADSAT